jgi:hypothetical protein
MPDMGMAAWGAWAIWGCNRDSDTPFATKQTSLRRGLFFVFVKKIRGLREIRLVAKIRLVRAQAFCTGEGAKEFSW